MCILYISQGDTFKSVFFDIESIIRESRAIGLEIDKVDHISFDDLERICQQESFSSWDIVELQPLEMTKHYHNGPEVRIIIYGQVIFNCFVDDLTYRLIVPGGYSIRIPDQCVHSFESYEHFAAIRFFTDPNGYQTFDID